MLDVVKQYAKKKEEIIDLKMKLESLGKAITDAYVAPSLSISDEQARALAAYPQVHVDVTALQAALDEKKRLEAYLRNKGLGEIIGS